MARTAGDGLAVFTNAGESSTGSMLMPLI
eukprot:COSAG06_NODE_17041_length_965_cov_1.247113_2_plen_28_part_01